VTRAEFERTGSPPRNLDSTRFTGYRMHRPSVTRDRSAHAQLGAVRLRLLEGIDKVSHEYGLGDTTKRSSRRPDRLVAGRVNAVPSVPRCRVVDHGQSKSGRT